MNLRMSSDLHSRIAAYSYSAGITMNEFINQAIRHELDHAMSM